MAHPHRPWLLLGLGIVSGSFAALCWLDHTKPMLPRPTGPSPTSPRPDVPLALGRATEPRPAEPHRVRRADPAPRRRVVRPVRVQGRLLRDGLPVRRGDLRFHADALQWRTRQIEWGLTDRHGRFEVSLPPGRYVVCSDDAPAWLVAFDVPSQSSGLEIDFHLLY